MPIDESAEAKRVRANCRVCRAPQRRAVTENRVERGHDVIMGTGLDASGRGVRVVVPTELVRWERVQITVSLPDGPLTSDGEVVRVEHLGPKEVAYGIYFTGLNAEEMARLQRLEG